MDRKLSEPVRAIARPETLHNQQTAISPYHEAAVSSSVSANTVLKNTYWLLGGTLAFSALIAYLSMNAPRPGFLVVLAGFYGLLFLTYKLQNSAWGLASVFALTGFMGYTLGPVIGAFAGAGAMHIVANALTMTAIVFFGLSAYAITTKKDFSFLSGFLTAGFFVLLGAMVISFFVQSSILQLAISAGFAIFSSAAILYQTGQIVRGGETNYILATVTLFVSIYNLFLSLLSLLSAFSGDD
jgi:modulator of FtsH protease